MNIHYAYQTCDIASNQSQKRYCSDSKTEIVKKCITSFLKSVQYAAKQRPESNHIIQIFDDRSTEDLKQYLQHIIKTYSNNNITINIEQIKNGGVMNSIRACWEWLEQNGTDLVYQVQDDYMYDETAIFEMVDMWFQLAKDTETHAIISPYNDPYTWYHTYKYKVTPRMVVLGLGRYWIQTYDTSCSFMTSKLQFSQHWDLYETFLNTPPNTYTLESASINKMMSERGVLSVMPINSVALHMQSELEKDPYIDWKSKWDSIDITGR